MLLDRGAEHNKMQQDFNLHIKQTLTVKNLQDIQQTMNSGTKLLKQNL